MASSRSRRTSPPGRTKSPTCSAARARSRQRRSHIPPALLPPKFPFRKNFPEESEEIEDYSSPKDKEAILHDMRSIKSGLLIRIAAMIVLFAAVALPLACRPRHPDPGGELLPAAHLHPARSCTCCSYMVCLCVVSAHRRRCLRQYGGRRAAGAAQVPRQHRHPADAGAAGHAGAGHLLYHQARIFQHRQG